MLGVHLATFGPQPICSPNVYSSILHIRALLLAIWYGLQQVSATIAEVPF
jgi:hypothetical protein